MTYEEWKKCVQLPQSYPLYNAATVRKLVERIDELESDRRRLEWLALNNARVWLQDGWYDIHDNGRYLYCFMVDDWRDAIDKAMQEVG